MEYWVDPLVSGEVDFVGGWADALYDSPGAQILVLELPFGPYCFNVLRRDEDLVAYAEGHVEALLVCLALLVFDGLS